MKIFECLMLGLLATSAMVPAINAAEATKEDASVRRVFLYDATACHAEKELYFKFKSLFSNVCREMGAKIQGLQEYLQWKPREGILPTMHDGFQQALTQGIAQLDAALSATPRLDRARVLGLFDALAARESRIYESLFGQADRLIGYLNTTTLPDPSVTSDHAFLNGCSIMISPIDPEAQFHYLAVAHQLGFESNRLKVLSPSLIDTNQASWSLLAYLTNTSDVKATAGTCYPVKQEALNIFHSYGNGIDPKAAEYQFLAEILPESSSYSIELPLHFDLAEARRIAAIMAGGNPPPPYTSQPSIVIGKAEILAAARVDGWNASVVRYVPVDHVVETLSAAAGKMIVAPVIAEEMPIAAPPPPPKVVELFSPQAKLDFERVKTTLDTLHVAQEIEYAAGRRFHGYSKDEQIMAYGNDSVIPAALRVDVNRLLADQLRLRDIVVPRTVGYDAAASNMTDWVRERITKDGLMVNVEEVLTGLSHIQV